MSYRLIAEEKPHHPVSRLARVLGVSRAGFYAWQRRPPSERSRADAALLKRIKTIHEETDGIYGAPRIHAELVDEHGIRVGRKRVARLMRVAGLPTTTPPWRASWPRVKTELINRRRFKTKDEARSAIFSYLEVFDNPRRRHKGLGQKSPAAYEKMLATASLEHTTA